MNDNSIIISLLKSIKQGIDCLNKTVAENNVLKANEKINNLKKESVLFITKDIKKV